ncbi:ABC transporter ATP-binding protein [Arenibaculum pallidiluteum]|uniref:ABC transporter ATP-binding protein n=1 Tax=Arenibaculum pallidiluteum TaxID=2812559 RepID=UPI001A974F38|nr:ABC transporter ATP-binding protein [Arenibaculum pallidiluteum]
MRIEIDSVSRVFGGHAAVDGVSLTVGSGEFVVLLGPSGCGKTTLLRLIAGLEEPDGGAIRLDGRPVAGQGPFVGPGERNIGIVFQSYALWPHMTVAGNVGFALKVRGLPRAEREARIARALAQVGLQDHGRRFPFQLSGGQRQRVAVARCLAMSPPIILLDEPLANLDPNLRGAVLREFRQMHRELRSTFVYVTHDQAEAFALADRIAIMDAGRVIQFAPPREIFEEPRTAGVARFVGSGALLPAELLARTSEGRMLVRVLGHQAVVRCAGDMPTGSGMLCLKRRDVALHRTWEPGLIEARVADLRYQGGGEIAVLALPDGQEIEVELGRAEPAPAMGARVGLSARDGWVIPGAVAARASEAA